MLNFNHLWLQSLQKIPGHLRVVQVTSTICIIIGSLVLLGWYFDIEVLKSGFPGSNATMKANTAMCMILSGISLWFSQKNVGQNLDLAAGENRNFSDQKILSLWISRLCAVTVTVIGIFTILEYLSGWNFGIDELLFRDSSFVDIKTHFGRMGLNTAFNFLFVGIALELLINSHTRHSYWYTQSLSLLVALISLQVVIGYTYQVKLLNGIEPQTIVMALHTVISFMMLSIGILWAYPEQGLMQFVISNTYGGLLARRLLLAAIVVPFVIGWLIVKGQQTGAYDAAFAISLFSIVVIVIFAILIWHSAAIIEHLIRQHDQAQDQLKVYEEKLRSFVNANIIGIVFADIYGGIQQANDEFLEMIGYKQEDILNGKLRWDEITPPELLYLDKQGIAEAKIKGSCTPYEKEFICQNGKRVLTLIGYVLLGEEKDEAVCFILNLSERQQAAIEQKQAEEKILQLNKDLQRRVTELQTLLEVIPIGIGIAEDPECKKIITNPAFAKQLRLSPEMNASLTAPSDERPTTFKVYREGRELTDQELPMQYSAAHGAEVLDFELDVVHNNGTIVNLLEYVAPLFDEEGKTRGCIGAFLDITERRQVEEVLRNQQKWLEDVLNLLPIPLLFIEPETARVTFANRAADEFVGGKFPQGRPAAEYHTVYYLRDGLGNPIPNAQMPGVRVARGERLDGLEMDWQTCAGIRSVLIFADTLPAMHGYPANCVMLFQDITKQKQVEKALSLGYQRLQLLFDTANNLLSSQQPVALIDSVFRKLSEQIGLDVYFNYLIEQNSPVMRLNSYRGISQELAKEIEWLEFGQAICGTVAQERRAIAVENVQRSTDPKTKLIRSLGISAFYCYPLIAQGRFLGTLSFGSRSRSHFTENQRGMMQAVCDQIAIAMERTSLIASLQQQTEQLSEANRMKDEFLAVLSHELRSPMNAILGWAQLLRSRKFNEAQIARALETIERNARGQTQLIDDLLDISRMIRGKLRLNVRTCDLVPIIESTIETVSLAAQAKDINLRFVISPLQEYKGKNPEFLEPKANVPEQLEIEFSQDDISSVHNLNARFLVAGDSERLQQIVWNLLANAIKFTPQGGRVEVRLLQITAYTPEVMVNLQKQIPITSYAQIQVIDTGIGIHPEFLPYVFDRFRQADSSTTRLHGGLGLGLALVRHLVELHGGTVHVDSSGHEQGATFTLKLPLLLASRVEISQPASKKPGNCFNLSMCPSLFGVRVVVVDDEADSRDFITKVLEHCQAEVQAVASVSEALRVILNWKPDVLISDIGMPLEDGYSLIRKVRSQPPEKGGKIPAAALTAYIRAEDRMRAIQEGYQLHLPKPIEPAELATVVASLVGRK
jgi:PAS domain S-box-containing protein